MGCEKLKAVPCMPDGVKGIGLLVSGGPRPRGLDHFNALVVPCDGRFVVMCRDAATVCDTEEAAESWIGTVFDRKTDSYRNHNDEFEEMRSEYLKIKDECNALRAQIFGTDAMVRLKEDLEHTKQELGRALRMLGRLFLNQQEK